MASRSAYTPTSYAGYDPSVRVLVVLFCACGRLSFEPTASDALVDDALPPSGCAAGIDVDTVALYTFESELAFDATRAHDGVVRNGNTVSAVPGPCGAGAARFAPSGYILVPDSPAFDLATGSIELYIRAPTPAMEQTFFSRDALNTALPGHFQLLTSAQGELLIRLQHGSSHYRCAGVLPANQWVHVGISFGARGFQMWVDGVLATQPSSMFQGMTIDCTVPINLGIGGNDNAFVLGAGNGTAVEGATDPVVGNFLTGEIDHVHLRSTWRDFGAR
jgi:hypothetical protein